MRYCVAAGIVLPLLLLFASVQARSDIHGLDILSIDNTDSLTAAMLGKRNKAATRIFGPKELAAARRRVWEEWRRALIASVDTSLLPPVRHPLGADTTAVWYIPEALEPHADMLIHYGFKGDSALDADAKIPLFVYLHGSGPRDHEWRAGLALAQRFDDAPSIYIIPQIANEGEWYRWYQRGKQQAFESWLRLSLARGTDPDRTYLFGISEGGYGSQRLASFYADYLAGAGPMAGGEPLRNAPPENLRNTAFSFLTGADDEGFYRNQLTAVTKEALDSLQQLCPDAYIHRIELIPGMGHHVDYSRTTPWLARHVRKPMPLSVSWENFDMDGRRRNTFANLAVSEPQHLTDADGTPLRTRYDMTVDSAANSVSLDVRRVNYTVTQTDPIWGIQLLFSRSYTPADDGLVRVYLAPEMLDLSKPVTFTVNGRRLAPVRLEMTEEALRESVKLFGDPHRLFPTYVTIDLASMSID